MSKQIYIKEGDKYKLLGSLDIYSDYKLRYSAHTPSVIVAYPTSPTSTKYKFVALDVTYEEIAAEAMHDQFAAAFAHEFFKNAIPKPRGALSLTTPGFEEDLTEFMRQMSKKYQSALYSQPLEDILSKTIDKLLSSNPKLPLINFLRTYSQKIW